jgi:hypothetical protein
MDNRKIIIHNKCDIVKVQICTTKTIGDLWI